MPLDLDLNDPLTSAGLAVTGGASLTGSAYIHSLLKRNNEALNNWNKATIKHWDSAPAYFSKSTNRWLQTSPEMADKLLDTYAANARAMASQTAGPVNLGKVIGAAKRIPNTFKKWFGMGDTFDNNAQKLKYEKLSNPSVSLGELKAHLITDVVPNHSALNGDISRAYSEQMRNALNSLPEDARAIIGNSSSIADKYKALKALPDKAGLNYLEDFILGSSDIHPGAAKFVGGGVIGKIDPVTGNFTDSTLHAGLMKRHKQSLGKVLRFADAANKIGAGAKGLGAALGLYGLGSYLGNQLTKGASYADADKSELIQLIEKLKGTPSEESDAAARRLLGLLEASAGSGITTFAGSNAIDSAKQLIADQKKIPNLNVGFSYGVLPEIGDGHKAPANNIRQILERYVAKLPEGHELKGKIIRDANGNPVLNEYGFAKREGGIQFEDLVHKAHGITPNHAKDYNIIYNTGLGQAVPHQLHSPNTFHNKEYASDIAKLVKGNAQTIKNYVTDTPYINAKGLPQMGATAGPGFSDDLFRLQGHGYGYLTDQDVLGYGKIPTDMQDLFMHRPLLPGKFKNLAPDVVGTPFINPATLDNMNKYVTRDEKLGRLKELIDAWDPKDVANRDKVSKIYDAIKKGKRVVTIAGSGRGDYVGNRTLHLLDSLDRLGVNNVEVVPLMGGYTGSKTLHADDRAHLIDSLAKADTKGRVTSFGRLDNEAYTLLQQLSDINMATSGQMGVSEAANAGNLQILPEEWMDSGMKGQHADMQKFQRNVWNDILRKNGRKPATTGSAANFLEAWGAMGGSTPQLSDWNGGTLQQYHKVMPDVFKQIKNYKGDVRPGVAQYYRNWGASDDSINMLKQKIDTDYVADLLRDANKGTLAELNRKAFDAAAANRAKLTAAHDALAEDMVSTIKNNISKPKLKALPGLVGNTLGAGIGAYGVIHGIKNIFNPNNYKLNLTL